MQFYEILIWCSCAVQGKSFDRVTRGVIGFAKFALEVAGNNEQVCHTDCSIDFNSSKKCSEFKFETLSMRTLISVKLAGYVSSSFFASLLDRNFFQVLYIYLPKYIDIYICTYIYMCVCFLICLTVWELSDTSKFVIFQLNFVSSILLHVYLSQLII